MQFYSPIALFVYNRPEHTRKTVEALLRNPEASESELFIFSDGSKSRGENKTVEDVRNYIKTITGFKAIHIIPSPDNLGLSKSIVSGISRVLETHDRIIVLEDDLVTSPHFLAYMNEGLDIYEKEEGVISIHGYVYPVKNKLPDTFFLKGADCWGWATWKRGWQLFENDGKYLLQQLIDKGLQREFDFNNRFPFTEMLRKQVSGKNDSWAIKWYASAFLQDRLTLYPGSSLVHNIGNDRSGTHRELGKYYDTKLSKERLNVNRIAIEPSNYAFQQFSEYFNARNSLFQKILAKLFKN